MTYTETIDAYLAGPAALREAVAGMTREELVARPVPGKWSTLEVVCHIADFDPVLADRMKRILALDTPPLAAADENLYAARLAYQDRDLDTELALIELTRRQLAAILRTVPAAAWERVGIHSERGPKTLADILTAAARHIPHHLPFIAEKRKALRGSV